MSFTGVRGTSWSGDIAIDGIEPSPGCGCGKAKNQRRRNKNRFFSFLLQLVRRILALKPAPILTPAGACLATMTLWTILTGVYDEARRRAFRRVRRGITLRDPVRARNLYDKIILIRFLYFRSVRLHRDEFSASKRRRGASLFEVDSGQWKRLQLHDVVLVSHVRRLDSHASS